MPETIGVMILNKFLGKGQIMRRDDEQTIVEVVLYILGKTKGLDMYHLFKVMYFAERAYLAKYGRKMTEEDYYALRWGPVPSHLYDAVKEQGDAHTSLGMMLWDNVKSGDEIAKNYLFAKREYDRDLLPEAAIDVLSEAVSKYAYMPFSDLLRLSHDMDWRRAMDRTPHLIDPIDTAKVGGADDATIDYLREDLEWNKAFN